MAKNTAVLKSETPKNNILNKRMKKFLDDIIDVAFSDKDKTDRKKYKKYTLNIMVKENATTSGMYRENSKSIEVYNPSLGSKHLAKCCLHELSHHIDACQHGTSGHQKPFYGIYAKLIYASLDMGILSVKDFDDSWSSDQNKVRAIVAKYVPHPVEYKAEFNPVVRVYNGFSVKDVLKQNGYRWNGVEQVWEKTIYRNREEEEKILTGSSISKQPAEYVELPGPYYIIVQPEMYVDAIIYIVAEGNTYDRRDHLKKYHFYYSKEKKTWLCKVKASELKNMLKSLEADADLAGIRFGVLRRKK